MKITFRLVLLVAAAGLGFWLWTVLFPGPEKVVLKKMSSLAATASYRADDSNLTRAGKAASLAGFFATDVQITINLPDQPGRTFSGREEVKESALAGFATLSSLKVEFFDTTVVVGSDRLTADVNCTANITVAGNKDYGVQELHFQFKKIDGDWRIIRVETVKTLS